MAYRLLPSNGDAIDIGSGAIVDIAPVTAVRMLRARAAIDHSASLDDAEGQVAFILALAEQCIIGWTGVEDANGDPAEITPAAIAALLSDYRVFELVQAAIVRPYMERAEEKND